MAKISSENAVNMVGSRYDLVLIASRRARELKHGWDAKVECDNGPIVTALREVEAGLVGREYLYKPANIGRHESPNT